MSSKLFDVVILFVWLHFLNISSTKAIKVEPITLSQGPYYCYLRCLARCVQKETSLEPCKEQCQDYKNETFPICNKHDASCWQQCKDMPTENNAPSTLVAPVLLYANYSLDPEPNPRLAVLEWTSVKGASLYVVEYVESDDKFQTWETGGLDRVETNLLKTTITKKNLCPEYEFRVAAINANTVSQFSDVVTLPKPIPYVPNPNTYVEQMELLPDNYTDITGAHLSDGTVRATVQYKPPPGWNLKNNEYTPVFGYSHLISCEADGGRTPSYAAPVARLSSESPTAYFDYPAFVYENKCLFIAPLEMLKSKCGTSFKYYADTQTPGPMLNFTCANVKNTTCYKPPLVTPPICNVANFSFTKYRLNETDFVSSTLAWKSMSNVPKLPIEYWVIRLILSEKNEEAGQYYPALQFKTVKVEDTRRICSADDVVNHCNGTIQTQINDVFRAGSFYVVQICSIYNKSTENDINWGMAGRVSLDFTDEPLAKTIYKHATTSESWVTAVAAGVSVLVFFLFVSVAICIFLGRKRRVRPKNINELGRDIKSEGYNTYVDMPRHFDQWELPRKRLIVYEDQKLGSGAFGAVYKGKIGGKLLTHKDSMSVLAENWMKAEDCEVAVKMLPEYADDTSKSDFRKEINLMKQLGYHERLVNMLACITAEDPLCLIVEYCSEGDLLHYLRDRRKYMIKLEQNNVDMQNLSEDNEDVDFTMILCLKDLISFAWQISVGLEYLSQKGFIHRDVAARNILVDKGKKAKIGDFGLCRFSYSDPIYMGKGGRLPIKWMALEAIKNYEFTIKSDVWSFGVLLFEIITLGGSPYPGIQPSDMEQLLESGNRMEEPACCPPGLYDMMIDTWQAEPEKRPDFSKLREDLRAMLEALTVDYSYLSLNQKRDYYNVVYGDDQQEQKALGQQYKRNNALKQYHFTPDHEIEFNSDNAISDNVFLSNEDDENQQNQQQELELTASGQPQSIRNVPAVNLLHNAVHTDSISLTDQSVDALNSAPTNRNWRDSASSDQALITPVNNDNVSTNENGKKKIFKFFKPANIPEEFGEGGYDNSAYSTSNGSNNNVE